MSAADDASEPVEQRPRPQYGEYATPEEQRARMGLPAQAAPLAAEPMAPAPMWPAPGPAGAAGAPGVPVPTASAPVRSRFADRVITIALLVYGLVNVLTSIPVFTDYAETFFQIAGVEAELSDPAAARPWGLAAAIVLGLGWLLTAALSVWSLRRGRLTWWIPLVGGVVFTLVTGTLLAVPLMSDPAVWDAVLSTTPAG